MTWSGQITKRLCFVLGLYKIEISKWHFSTFLPALHDNWWWLTLWTREILWRKPEGITSIKRMNWGWFVGHLETMVVNRCLLHQLLIANGRGWLKPRPGYRYTYTNMSVMSLLRDGICFFSLLESLYCWPQLNTSILNDAPFIILIIPSRPLLDPPCNSSPPR